MIQCVSIKLKTQGATVRTILLDDFMWLAVVVWVCLLVTTLRHLFARTDIRLLEKVVWALAVFTIPMGAFAYMALQNRAITDRAARPSGPARDPELGSTFNISDEIAEMDRLVPIIQQAIEIKGILETEDGTTMTTQSDQIGLSDERTSRERVYAREPGRSSSVHDECQRSPVISA